MPFVQKVNDSIFGDREIKIWATSKQSFDKYYPKMKDLFNILMSPDLDINLSPIDHIEIIRSNIKIYFCTNIAEAIRDYQFANHRIICIKNEVSIT